MEIDTRLSVSMFNVFKYFFTVFFIEIMTRRGIENIRVFIRRLDLHSGLSVPLYTHQLDRYSISNARYYRHFSRVLLWFFLVFGSYAVEILSEFSVETRTDFISHSETMEVLNATTGVCSIQDITQGLVPKFLTSMALKCVRLENDSFYSYNPVWIHNGQSREAKCTQTPKNILRQGPLIYDNLTYTEGSSAWNAVQSLISDILQTPTKININSMTLTGTLSVSNTDIFFDRNISEGERQYRTALWMTMIPGSSVVCAGNIHGRYGEGVMKIRLYACVQIGDSVYTYLKVSGTAPIFYDVEDMVRKPWDKKVAMKMEFSIYDFTNGVFEGNRMDSILAYSTVLSLGANTDINSLNKYAIVYKFCELYRVPQTDDAMVQTVKHSKAEERITIVLSEWGILMLLSWSIGLYSVSVCLLIYGHQMKLVEHVVGERDIALRWATREAEMSLELDVNSKSESSSNTSGVRVNEGRKSCFHRGSMVYLNVQAGCEFDEILPSLTPRVIARDPNKLII